MRSAVAHKQPVKQGHGRQCAALPLTQRDGDTQVLLVTSRDTGRWVLPKGWAEKGLSEAKLAAKEAYEEAGAVGRVAPMSIGAYQYPKRLPEGRVLDCVVRVFALRVARLLDDWPERAQRRRQWFTLAQAAAAVDEGELAMLLLHLTAATNADAPKRVRKLVRSIETGRKPVPLPDHSDCPDYPVLIEPLSAEGGGYLATVPDLPGCVAVGATRELAARDVGDAIASWIGEARALGRKVPPPSRYLVTTRTHMRAP
jgi:predicted RNase H-like HicB family nuclease/8-oxo-dGTP pyrophosphatase MutT (NUDIX family)